ncbi:MULTISPECIES: hypothetical protein [Cyanophyceae]|nr:hypothetical protein [Trichocoleus sp. FACHB-40]
MIASIPQIMRSHSPRLRDRIHPPNYAIAIPKPYLNFYDKCLR